MRHKILITILLSTVLSIIPCFSQNNLPPGWDTFSPNPSFETAIILDNVFPTIDNEILETGDYIGAFYQYNGNFYCGGAKMYEYGLSNSVILYGDDSFTTHRDGFVYNDSIYWKVYKYQTGETVDMHVEYQTSIPHYSYSGKFVASGITSVLNIASNDFRAYTYITPYNSCRIADTTITASCQAVNGSGNYSYSWSSFPAGISGNTPVIEFHTDEYVLLEVTITDLETNDIAKGYTCHFIIPAPIVEIASDTAVCGNSPVHLYPVIQGEKALLWSTTGDGFFNNLNSDNPIYTPGPQDYENLFVQLTVNAYSLSPCYDTTIHTINVNFLMPPSITINSVQSSCTNDPIALNATTENVTSVTWSSTGDGSFTNPNDFETEYIPGNNDITVGHVVITATGTPDHPSCFDNASVSKNIIIRNLPTVIAGNDISACEGDYCPLNGYSTNHNNIFWTTDGDGFFNISNIFNATYTPGANDIANGGCTLTLNAVALSPCADTITDDLSITIIRDPQITICEDIESCNNSIVNLSVDTAYCNSIIWSTSGSGTFSDNTSTTPTYTPSQQDVENNGCDFFVTASSASPCNTSVTETVHLTINQLYVELDSIADILIGSTICFTPVIMDGSGDYSINWSPDTLLLNPDSLNTCTLPICDTTLFTINVTDNQTGCQTTANIVVNTIGEFFNVSISTTDDELCAGDNTTITAIPSDGDSTNYTFNWTSIPEGFTSTEQSFSVTPSVTTTYLLSATDGITTINDEITITVHELPITEAGDNQEVINGMSIQLNGSVSGIYNSYSYQWEPQELLDNAHINNPTTVALTHSTTFTLTGTDTINGCYTIDSVHINVIGDIFHVDIQVENDIICLSDSTTLTATAYGGSEEYTYSWTCSQNDFSSDESSIVVTPDTTTSYYLYVTDGISSYNDTLTITVNNPPSLFIENHAITICEGDDCQVSGSASDYHTILWITSGDGTFNVNDSINTTYTPGNQDIENAGCMLFVNILPNSPCSETLIDTVIVSINRNMTLEAGNDTIICNNTPFYTNATGANYDTITWSTSGDGSFDDENILNATYYPGIEDITNGICILTVTGVSSCSGVMTDSLTLQLSAIPTVEVGNDIVMCEDNIATLSGDATNYSSIEWSTDGSGTFSDIYSFETTYIPSSQDIEDGVVNLILSATSIAPCDIVVSDTLQLTIYKYPEVSAGDNQVILIGSNTTLEGFVEGGSGNFTYQWMPDTAVVSPNSLTTETIDLFSSTIFTLTVYDEVSECETSATTIVTVEGELLNISLIADNTTICDGTSTEIMVLPSGGGSDITYSWTSNPEGFTSNEQTISVSPQITTTYIVTADDNISIVTDSITIAVIESPVTFAGEDQSIYPGLQVTLNGSVSGNSDDYEYSWTPANLLDNPHIANPTTQQLTETVTFTLTGTDLATGCQSTDEVTVYVTGEPFVTAIEAEQTSLCYGESTVIAAIATGGNETYTYSWSSNPEGFTSTEQEISVTPLETTTYFVEITDGTSTNTENIEITVNSLPITEAGEDIDTNIGNTVTLNGSVSGEYEEYSYHWTPEEYFVDPNIPNPTTIPLTDTITFTLVGTDVINGCQSSDEITVNVSGSTLDVELTASSTTICSGDSVTIYANATGGSGNYTFSWTSLPIGFSSDEQNPTAYPAITTTFIVNVYDGFTNVNEFIIINVNPTPTVDAGEDIYTYPNCITTLDGSISGGSGSYTYSWEPAEYLDNPNIPNPTTIPLSETMTFTLTGTDNETGCQSVDEVEVIVTGEVLDVTVTSSSDEICVGESSLLTATPTGGSGDYSYSWTSEPEGFTSTEQNPTVTPTTTTTYIVTVNDSYATVSGSVTIDVNEVPEVDAGNNITIYPGLSITMDAIVTGGSGDYSYSWEPAEYFDDPTILNPTTIILEESMVFTLTATDNESGCENSDSINITVAGNPFTISVYATPDTTCGPEICTLSVTATGGTGSYTYNWSSIPEGFSSSSQFPTTTPETTTTYIVEVSDGVSVRQGEVTIVVNEIPTTDAGEDQSIYSGLNAQLEGLISGGSGTYSYSWSPAEFLDNPNIANPTTIALYEDITFTLTGTDAASGCQSTDFVTITIAGEVLTIDVTASDTTICYGESAILSANASGGSGNYSYQWTSIPAGFYSEEESPVVTPLSYTRYLVTVTDDYFTAEGSVDIDVFSEIHTSIIASNDTISDGATITFEAFSNVDVTYLWLPYNYTESIITLEQNDYQIGDNEVILETTDFNGCVIYDTAYFYVKDYVGIIEEDEIVNVRPNPFDNRFYIDMNTTTDVTIYNLSGQIVKHIESNGETTLEIDATDWEPGIYIVRTKNNYYKIVKM